MGAKQHGEQHIDYTEIREWIVADKNGKDKGKDFKCKGYLIDCKHKTCAYKVQTELLEFIHKKVKDHCTNICRLVQKEFGENYMKIQLLPKKKRPKQDKYLRNKPQGPKYPYLNGEPSISDMESNKDKVEV